MGLHRRIDHLLAWLMVEGQGGCRDRGTCGTNERMVCGSSEYPLTHVGRVTQNRTGGHLTRQTTDCTPVLGQVQGDGGRGLIVIGGGKKFLFLNGHELAFDLALSASLACLTSGVGRGALKDATIRGKRGRRGH